MLPGVLAFSLLSAAPAPTLSGQLAKAALVLEVEVSLGSPASKLDVAARLKKGLAKRTVTRVLFPPGGPTPGQLPEPALTLTPGTPCFARAATSGALKAVVLYEETKRGWRALALPGQETGRFTSLDDGYGRFIEALVEAKHWHEERMRAVGPELLWQRQKAALVSDSAYLRALARDFLVEHEAAEAVDKAWGAAGTPERAENEKNAELPAPLCPGG